MRFKALIWELHRRHVFKAGVAYLVVSWMIVQVLDVMIPAFTLPKDLMPLSIVVLMVCFPIWLGISWFYDITKDGIVRTKRIGEDEEFISTKSVNLNKVIITSLSVLVILLIVNTFRMKAETRNLMETAITETAPYNSSIAVLAFVDMSQGQDQEYFADGISEEITNKLNQIKELNVIARTSAFSYKNRNVNLQTIARELDVEYILEGSVRVSDNMFRITAQLIDGSDGAHIWSENFDREIEDILLTQDEIASIVAERLEVSLLIDDVRSGKVNPEAHVNYFKANKALKDYSRKGTLIADSLIHKSLELDNNQACYWTTLVQVIFSKTYHYSLMETALGHTEGVEAAMKAIELDPRNALAYSWLSRFEWQNKRADLAEQHLITALELSNKDPSILFQAAKFSLRTNQLSTARKYLDRSILLDPKSEEFYEARDVAYYTRSFLNWTLGNLDEAGNDLLKAYSLDLPDYLKNYELALLCRDRGQYEEAISRMENEKDPYLKTLLECSILYATGKKTAAMEVLQALQSYLKNGDTKIFEVTEEEHNYEIACLYAYMGDTDNAFAYLDASFETILIWPDRFFTTPEFNNLHGDPRWDAFLIRMGNVFNYSFHPQEE